jgi:hypothetical protein
MNWKKYSHILFAIASLASLLIVSVGCKTTSPERAAVNTLKTTTLTIEELEDAWGDHVVAGKATESQKIAVESAHERYRASLSLLRSSIIAAAAIGGDKAETDVTLAINQLTADKITLINLIRNALQK